MDGEIPHLPAGGMAELFGLGNCPFQRNAHIPQRHQSGLRVLKVRPVRGRFPGDELEHGEAQHVRRLVHVAALPVDHLNACVIRHKDVDFTGDIDALCVQNRVDARADDAFDGKFLQTQLLKYDVYFMSHVNSSSDDNGLESDGSVF